MFYEKISREDLQAMENEYGFTPNYSYEDYVIVKKDDGEIVEEYYVNLTIHKTADEVYQEWLESKDNPPTPQPTVAQLKAQIDSLNSQSEFTTGCLMDMATVVYA